MDLSVTYSSYHNHLNGCTSNGPLNHFSICGCGHTYTKPHNFKPFKDGNKCIDCGYYTTAPIISGPIL